MRARNILGLPKHPDYPSACSVVYWSLSGFDSVSTFAGEVCGDGGNPRVPYRSPRAYAPLCVLCPNAAPGGGR
jgi:hypothetical protein